MKKITLTLLDVQLLPTPDARGNVAVLITKVATNNPSKNGVHAISAGQLQRIVTRAIGLFNPIGFKHIVSLCNGSAKLTIDMEECKQGDAWKNERTGETGTYEKDWIKYSNHAVELGVLGSMKLAELSLSASFAQVANQYAAPIATTKPVAVVAGQAEDNQSSDEQTDKASEVPNVG
jgi:hypothetical protein